MKKTLIFSDVHLRVRQDDSARQQEFVRFLRSIQPQEFDRIICLGDLFDFWFEYRHVIFSGYFDALRALADLRDAGLELHLICGNHDFWAGRFLRDSLGFQVHQGHVVLPFAEKRVHFVHGDGINPRDRAYRFYRRFARNSLVIALFRLLHPDWAMQLAQGVSHGSRTMLEEKNPAEGAEARALRTYAAALLERGEADVVMCGHAHAAHYEELPGKLGQGLYINTGDWLTNRSYVVWDGQRFEMRSAS